MTIKITGENNAEEIANHDPEDSSAALHLYRTAKGEYFLRTEKVQVLKDEKWIDVLADGSTSNLPRNTVRWNETDTPMTEKEAIDWYLATVAHPLLAKAIRQQIDNVTEVGRKKLAA